MRRGGAGKRRDSNEHVIIEALLKCGADVWQVNGYGLPDLIVRHRGVYYCPEIKTTSGRMRASQGAFPVWRSIEEALTAIGVRG